MTFFTKQSQNHNKRGCFLKVSSGFVLGYFLKLVDFKSNANTEGQVVEDNPENQKLGQCKLMEG